MTPQRTRLHGRVSRWWVGDEAPGSDEASVVAVFPAAAYLLVSPTSASPVVLPPVVLPLVRPDGLRLPTALLLNGSAPDLRDCLEVGQTGWLRRESAERGSLQVGGLDLRWGSTWAPAQVASQPEAAANPDEIERLGADPALRARARALAQEWRVGRRGTLADLIGAGRGLTPTGDDVVCGVALVALAAGWVTSAWLGDVLDEAGHRTTSLSASLLSSAARGYGVPEVVALTDDLLDPSTTLSAERVGAVHAIGHSSGRDLCAGLAGAADLLATPESHNRETHNPELLSPLDPRSSEGTAND